MPPGGRTMQPRSLCNLNFNHPIQTWDEAIPLGNGLMGALIWGNGNPLKFSLDRVDLWDRTRHPNLDHPDYNFSHLISLVKDGDTEEIDRFFEAPYLSPTPTKLPAGRLEFNFGNQLETSSSLDLAAAEAKIKLSDGIRTICLYSFCHAITGTGFIKITGLPGDSELDYAIRNPQFNFSSEKKSDNIEVDSVVTSGLDVLTYPAPVICDSGEFRYYIQEIDQAFRYGIFTKYLRTEKDVLLAYRIVSSNDGDNLVKLAEEYLDAAL